MSEVKPILIVRAGMLTQQEAASIAQALNAKASESGYCALVCSSVDLQRNEFKFSTLTPGAKLTAAQMKKLKALLSKTVLKEEKQEKGERKL